MIQECKELRLIGCPNPFSSNRIDKNIKIGCTIKDIVAELKVPNWANIIVHVNYDRFVPKNEWDIVIPKENDIVVIRAVPTGGGGGGGGKDPVRTILTLAVVVAATTFGGPLIGSALYNAAGIYTQAAFTAWSAIGTAAFMTAGMLAINAICPPPSQDLGRLSGASGFDRESNVLSISGARNRVSLYGPVPVILGRHRTFPNMGATPYTEIVGNDEYLRLLFVVGYGPLSLSDFKIGETALSDYEDVEVEVRYGYNTDTNLTLYSSDVHQDNLNIVLTNAGGYQTRTTQPNTDEISVDIGFGRGLAEYGSSGEKSERTVEFEVQYAPTGTSNWSSSSGYALVAEQESDALPLPDTYIEEFFGGNTHRYDRIAIDKASGVIRTFLGQSTLQTITATPPPIPSNYAKIAKIYRKSDGSSNVVDADIYDERDSELEKQNTTDFAPSQTSPLSNKIKVSLGYFKLTWRVTGATSSLLRTNRRFKVTNGQYDVRIKRLTADNTATTIYDEATWTSLRSITSTYPINFPSPIAMVAMRIKATDQLNGSIDEFNCVATSIIKDWDSGTSTWIERETNNPASIFRYILQGSPNKRPLADSKIYLTGLQEWHNECKTNKYSFNHVVDYTNSIEELLKTVASSGRAVPGYKDALRTAIRDKSQTSIIQHFTPRNSWGFSSQKIFTNVPHAFKVPFNNEENSWQLDERIVYDDGYNSSNATLFEELQLTGITNASLAWKHARYHIATARLRPERYTINVDFENIICTRGDLVRVSNDVMLVGSGWGRIKTVIDDGTNITGITTDESLIMEVGKTYVMRFRLSDGSSLLKNINLVVGEDQTSFTFTTPGLIIDGPDVGDLFMFGESDLESAEYIVKSIDPLNDLSATLTLVDYSSDIYNADSGTIPEFTTGITSLSPLKVPSISSIRSDESTMIDNGSGNLVPRMIVSLSKTLETYQNVSKLQTQYRIANTDEQYKSIESSYDLDNIIISDVRQGEIYEIRLRYLFTIGTYGGWSQLTTHQIVGSSTLPADVTNFNLSIIDTSAYLSWDAVIVNDLSHYRIKYNTSVVGATWANSVDLVTKVSKPTTSISVQALTGTYLVKAVDYDGNESENETIVASNITSILGLNVVETITEDPTFSGSKVDCVVVDSKLRLESTDTMSDWTLMSAVSLMSLGESNSLNSSGTYYFYNSVDLTSKFTSRVTASLKVSGTDLSTLMSLYSLMSDIEMMSGTSGTSYGVELQIRFTDDDPSGAPIWSGWKTFVVGDYSARAFQFRVLLFSTVSTVTPLVEELSVTIDMPDRVLGDDNIVSDAGGTAVTFISAFRAVPAIVVTGDNLQTGDYWTLTSKSATGFTVRFFNSSDVGVSRQFDWVAKGYGEVTV